MYESVHLSIYLLLVSRDAPKCFTRVRWRNLLWCQMLLIYTFILVRVNKWSLTSKLYPLAFEQVWMPRWSGWRKDKPKGGLQPVPLILPGSVRNRNRHTPLCVCTCMQTQTLHCCETVPFVQRVGGSCMPGLPCWIIESEDFIHCLYRDY